MDVKTVRATRCVDGSKWYYEARVISAGVMRIGWVAASWTLKTRAWNNGIGCDNYSIGMKAYSGIY